jgi:Rrf2 family cysteine metabolism transcriptional repressor
MVAMTISAKSRYAVRALVELALEAGHAHPVRVGDLAARRGIPEQFLEQVFSALRRAGVLKSFRGVGGGFIFARDPAAITVLQVVEALDGLAAAVPGSRDDADAGAAAELWRQADAGVEGVLAATTIADLVERERQAHAGQPMNEI